MNYMDDKTLSDIIYYIYNE